jgi:alcohol dehydrogenase (cytochrome c)
MRLLALFLVSCLALFAQVDQQRLNNAASEPQNWLTYNGSYMSQHHSGLTGINLSNAKDLELRWVYQAASTDKFQTTPLVVDGVMYLTEPPNKLVALDPTSGREFWVYEHQLPSQVYPCCGSVNRGAAILGNTIFWGTLDAKLLAIDATTGKKVWETTVVENYEDGYSLTVAPLIIKDKVIVGTAGGEFGIRGFLAAYDAKTGEQVWKFKTIPEPGEPGHETWENDAWKTGGGSIWLTGSYDPELNLTYWGVGNPSPDWNPDVRPGDNLYTDSVIALDADTGKLKWHFQFTPHDEWDWDSVQIPVLADIEWEGTMRKLMLWANRNGFYYVLDRVTGKFLHGKAFVKQTWAAGLDEDGRPAKIPDKGPSKDGTLTWPGVQGGTNWYAPSYSPVTNLFYLSAWEGYYSIYYKWDQEYEPGKRYLGGSPKGVISSTRRKRFMNFTMEDGYGAVRALNPITGEKVWEFAMSDVSDSGLLSTASNVLFSGSREGHFFALDARDGKLLWTRYLGGQIAASPITYEVGGAQYVTVASGRAVFTFALPR